MFQFLSESCNLLFFFTPALRSVTWDCCPHDIDFFYRLLVSTGKYRLESTGNGSKYRNKANYTQTLMIFIDFDFFPGWNQWEMVKKIHE